MRASDRHFEAYALMRVFALLRTICLSFIGNNAPKELYPFALFADSITYYLTHEGRGGDGRLIGVDIDPARSILNFYIRHRCEAAAV